MTGRAPRVGDSVMVGRDGPFAVVAVMPGGRPPCVRVRRAEPIGPWDVPTDWTTEVPMDWVTLAGDDQ